MGAQQIFTSDDYNYDISFSTSLDPELGEISLVSKKSLRDSENGQHPPDSKPLSIEKNIKSMPGPLVACMMICSLCTNSTISQDSETKEWKPTGDPTEVALTVAGIKSGLTKKYLLENLGLQKAGEYAFDRYISND